MWQSQVENVFFAGILRSIFLQIGPKTHFVLANISYNKIMYYRTLENVDPACTISAYKSQILVRAKHALKQIHKKKNVPANKYHLKAHHSALFGSI